MSITLLGKKILVKEQNDSNQTESGIFIPDSVQKDVLKGTIEYAGEEVSIPKVGDTVSYLRTTALKYKIKESEYHLLTEDNILAIEQ